MNTKLRGKKFDMAELGKAVVEAKEPLKTSEVVKEYEIRNWPGVEGSLVDSISASISYLVTKTGLVERAEGRTYRLTMNNPIFK